MVNISIKPTLHSKSSITQQVPSHRAARRGPTPPPPWGPGGHALWDGGEISDVISDEKLAYEKKTKMTEIPKNKGLTIIHIGFHVSPTH